MKADYAHARDLWQTEFEVQTMETVGGDWPGVIVEKWERNWIGERRYVATRAYRLSDEQPSEDDVRFDKTFGAPVRGGVA